METKRSAEHAFNGLLRSGIRVDIPGMFFNLILEQKENKASGKKFAIDSRAALFRSFGVAFISGSP
jgi:hypothetical protein